MALAVIEQCRLNIIAPATYYRTGVLIMGKILESLPNTIIAGVVITIVMIVIINAMYS